jgi:pimeloyl-ACP methyl ester carboxylesterase
VPGITLHGACDEVDPPALSEDAAKHFTAFHRREVVPVAGHFFPREVPEKVVAAAAELIAATG